MCEKSIHLITVTTEVISNKWKTLIIHELIHGTKRFNQLKRRITGISSKVLADNLKQMEQKQIVTRQVLAETPVKVEYSLTSLGYNFYIVLEAMIEWGELYEKANLGQCIIDKNVE